MRRPIPSLTFIFAAIVLALGTLTPVRADVRDEADFFSPQTERQVTERMQQIRRQHAKDVEVETVASLPGTPAPGTAREEFLAGEVARRAKAAGINGVYVLVSRNPSTLYVGVDPQLQRGAFTTQDRGRVRDLLVERFKAEDFDGGIVTAMQTIDETLAKNASGAGAVAGAPSEGAGAAAGTAARGAALPGGRADEGSGTPAGDGSASRTGTPTGGVCGMGGMGSVILLVLAGLAVFMIVRAMSRRRQMAAGYGQPGMGQPGMGQPGYGQPGYGQPGMGGGGGMGRGLLGGLLGGMAGGYLYDKMSGPGGNEAQAATPPDAGNTPVEDPGTTSGYGDFGDAGGGGGDFGGGGGDFGGGDGGGGDF